MRGASPPGANSGRHPLPGYDDRGGTTRRGRPIYPGGVKSQKRGLTRAVGRAVRQVLVGREPAPASRSPGAAKTAYAAALLAAVLLVAAALGGVMLLARSFGAHPDGSSSGHSLGLLVVLFAAVAALALTPGFPLTAWRISYLAVLLGPLAAGGHGLDAGAVTVMLVVFVNAGLRRPRAQLWTMQAFMLIPAWIWIDRWVPAVVVTAVVLGFGALTEGIGAWLRARHALAEQTQRAQTLQDHSALLQERARIAREMHDVVAHHMSMIVVQAQTAPYRLEAGTVSEPVAREFAALGESAREALTEMRRLLGVLRADAPPEHAPQPKLADIPDLVHTARRAGAHVALSMPPQTRAVPAGVGIAAYRIVQEALSNAGRHAPGAAIEVLVDVREPAVELSVVNGPAAGHPRDQGGGHGLAGMRERAAQLGGWLRAGPAPDGGFAVRARLPLTGAVS